MQMDFTNNQKVIHQSFLSLVTTTIIKIAMQYNAVLATCSRRKLDLSTSITLLISLNLQTTKQKIQIIQFTGNKSRLAHTRTYIKHITLYKKLKVQHHNS